MARRNVIEILLTSKDSATPSIKVLGLSLTDLKSAIDMVARGARKMAQTVEAAFDFTEQGAAILQTRESFDRLGVSIEAMRDASLGTVDDMTLMSSTLTLTAGASEQLQAQLLQNAPQLLEIAKASNALNPLLGDTAHMYESIATGIKRSSPLILDNLGIVVKIGEANETYAAQIGKAVEALTAEEKQIALLNATIEAGRRLIEQTGGSVESYTDAWARLRVEIKNTTDAMKIQAAEGVQPLITGVADLLAILREYNDEVNVLRSNLGGMGDALGLAIQQQEKLDIQQGRSATAARYASLAYRASQERMIATSDRYAGLADYYASQQTRITDTAINSAETWDQYTEAIEGAQKASDDYAWEQMQATKHAERQAEAEIMLGAVNSDLSRTFRDNRYEMEDLNEERAGLIAQLKELEAGNGRAIVTTKKATLTEADRALVVAKLARDTEKLNAEIGKPIDDQNALIIAQMGVNIEGYNEKLGDATTTTTTFVDNGKKISEIEGSIAGVTGKMDELISKTREGIRTFILQQMQAQLAVDGWTEAEIEFFKGTAERFGMYDELWVQVTGSVAEHAQAVTDGAEDSDTAIGAMMDLSKDLAREAGVLREVMPVAFDETASAAGKATALIDSLVGVNSDVEGSFIDLGETGEGAIDDVTAAAGLAGAALMGAKMDADDLKAALDLLEEKDITIDVHFDVDELRVPSPRAIELRGPGLITAPRPIMNAAGGDYIVSRPTSFIAGEAGPERALFIPQGQPGFGGPGAAGAAGTRIETLEINVYGTADAHETARLVMAEMQGRGLMPQRPMR